MGDSIFRADADIVEARHAATPAILRVIPGHRRRFTLPHYCCAGPPPRLTPPTHRRAAIAAKMLSGIYEVFGALTGRAATNKRAMRVSRYNYCRRYINSASTPLRKSKRRRALSRAFIMPRYPLLADAQDAGAFACTFCAAGRRLADGAPRRAHYDSRHCRAGKFHTAAIFA